MPWYSFTPASIPTSDPSNPNQYILIGSTPPICGGPKNNICAIQATDNSGQPVITNSLKIEMANALENNIESANVLLKP